MGFEVRYIYHPRKDEGGYNTEIKEEKTVKVGKPFDDTPLDKCAAAIMAQLARRDIWVVDVNVYELVKKEISFKESKDGRGIVLKNKKFSLNQAAEMIAEEEESPPPPAVIHQPVQTALLPPGVQPHEVVQQQHQMDALYADPNRPVPVKRQQAQVQVNPKKILYSVYFDPEIIYANQVKGLKFTQDKKYPVHAIVPHSTGKLELQKIVVTDDVGRQVTVDEKFFTSAGRGLYGDNELDFSGANKRGERKPKLMYESEMSIVEPKQRPANIPAGIPLDDGTLPEEFFQVPDIRPGRKVM